MPEFVSRTVRKGEYYFLDLQPSSRHGLSVVCGGREWCGAKYEIERETFPFHSIEFVCAGEGEVVLQGRRYPLRPGDLFAYSPGVRHAIRGGKGKPMCKYFVDFAGERGRALLDGGPLGRLAPVRVPEPEAVEEIFRRLQEDGRQARRNARPIAALLVEMLLRRVEELGALPREADAQSRQTYRNCLAYIDEHCLRLKNAAAAARECHLSEPYLCRIFTRYHGCPPGRYLLQCKMARAAALLMGEQALVKEAAAAIGFEDPYHFSKAFKRLYGVSPEQFRRQRS